VQAFEMDDPCKCTAKVSPEMHKVIAWMGQHTAEEVYDFRENVMVWIEQAAAEFKNSGECEAWFEGCEPAVAKISAKINGPLMEMLIDAAEHSDKGCPSLFQNGDALRGACHLKSGCACMLCRRTLVRRIGKGWHQ